MTQSSDPVIDTTVFAQLARDTSEAVVPRMLAAFCTETRERVGRLQQAVETATVSTEALQHEAHTLKSSAATFGAVALQQVARDVEMACRNGDVATARDRLGELIASGEQAIAAVEDYLADQEVDR